MTKLAIKIGFRAIDTANQQRYYREIGVGEGLATAYRIGLVVRPDLFLQTKFTYLNDQDNRLPYDPEASLSVQVAQSMASSLKHLGTDYIDSYVLHGPFSQYAWTATDTEVWLAMLRERDAGRTRFLGISNVSLQHLEGMALAHPEPPAFVQNRCLASLKWDRDVRSFCSERKIAYQGFSLINGNADILRHPCVTGVAFRLNCTPEQAIFAFARKVGILPITGTGNSEHMTQNLISRDLAVLPVDIRMIYSEKTGICIHSINI